MSLLTAALSTLRRPFARVTAPDRDPRRDVIVFGPRQFGAAVTPLEALQLAAVWACVNVIAKSLAPCRWDVFSEDGEGNRAARRATTLYRLLNVRPNPEITAFSFREAMYIQALICGDFYAEIERDAGGRPFALWPLAYDRCTLERTPAGRLVLRVRNESGPDSILDYDDVFHVHGPSIDGLAGFDMVKMAARTFAHLSAAERFGHAFYANGTSMGGILKAPVGGNMKPEQVDDIREQIEKRHKGPERAFKFLLLQGGLEYQSLTVDPEKALAIETKYALIEDVCRWFGVPPHKIADLRRSTFSNIEHQGLEFVRDALTPWAERAAQEADWKLAQGPNIYTRIETDWLAEGDAKSKADTDAILVNNGLATRNEVRRARGRNTLGPEGDKLTVQMNMTTLEKIGVDPPKPLAAPDPPADPAEGEDDQPADPPQLPPPNRSE